MAVHTFIPRMSDEIHVARVSLTHWVVRGRPVSPGEPRRIFGHIDLCKGSYEVLELGDPVVFTTFSCLEEALGVFSAAGIDDDADAHVATVTPLRRHRVSA